MVFDKIVVDTVQVTDPVKYLGSRLFLYFSAFTVNLLYFTSGITLGWTSPVLLKLLSNDTDINPFGTPLTTLQVSIIASLPPIFSTLGLAVMARMTKIIGRKHSMILAAFIFVIAFNVMAFAKHIYVYYICLAFSGFSLGGFYINVPLYTAEIAEDTNRGKMGCFITFSVACGTVYGYVFGSITSVTIFNILCSIPAILHLFFSLMLQESPVYLATKGIKFQAMKSLEKLRGHTNYAQLELEYKKIEDFIKTEDKIRKQSVFDLFRTKSSRKAFFLSLIMSTSAQTCGMPILSTFIGKIFNEAQVVVSGNIIGIIHGLMNVLMCLTAIALVDKLGRRILMLFSTFSCSLAMFVLGLYFYFNQTNSDLVTSIRWLPVLFVVIFIFCFGVGINSLPLFLISELLPHDLREVGMAMIFIADTSSAFLVLSTFPLISSAYGTYCSLWFHSIFTFVVFNVILFYLPETKCKTFLEIQKLLSQ